ncbi:MAG: hypothetical protein E7351_00525 [Clostridiales bacterium]|nr:hypothetical protein [Clostridiales bacterium]
MIITITGKPCSGKGTVSKIFCQKYNFQYMCTGDMFRQFAKEYGFDNILDFQHDERVKIIDNLVDNRTIEIGKTRLDENIVLDSRLAWHFIPNSFKVFIDIDWETAGKRLISANRDSEKVSSLDEAITALKNRWHTENDRYQELYSTDNLNSKNYDFIIDSANLTPEEIAEKIYENYKKFIKSR